MTTKRFDDDLDALLKRHDPAQGIDPRRVARVSRMVLTRIAAEDQRRTSGQRLFRLLNRVLGSWDGLPRYAGSLALGLALGLAVGLAGLGTGGDATATGAAQLFAQAQPLTPLGL